MTSRHFDTNYGKPLYQEVIRWSFGLWIFVAFLDLSIIFAIWAALDMTATFVTLIVISILTIALYRKSALRITVTQGWLLVGPAAIERAYIHNFQILNKNEMRNMRGLQASPLNFLQIRFWTPAGIKLSIRDPKDPTPAWIISSRNGEQLIKVLEKSSH